MARPKSDDEPGKAAAAAAKEADPPEDAEAFPLERLIQDSDDLLGAPRHVVAGAVSKVRKKELTVEEGKKAVSAYLKAKEDTDPIEPPPEAEDEG